MAAGNRHVQTGRLSFVQKGAEGATDRVLRGRKIVEGIPRTRRTDSLFIGAQSSRMLEYSSAREVRDSTGRKRGLIDNAMRESGSGVFGFNSGGK
jgi:hypothetical protein